MRIKAQLLAMAEAEILEMIPASAYRRVVAEDPHPLFKAFVIGQEGDWTPQVEGFRNVVTRWFKTAIQAISEKLGIGTKVFHLHAQTNSHEGRMPVGEVVGKTLQKISGMASAVAAIWIYPSFRDLPLDVASIEATIETPEEEGDFEVTGDDIMEITGIALGDSRTIKPACVGATLITQLQAFAESRHNLQGGEGHMLTPAEIKKAIREANLTPSDVFSTRELLADGSVKEELEAKVPANAEFARMRREVADAEKRATESTTRAEKAEKELGETKGKLTDASGKLVKITARESLAAALKERKLIGDDGKPKDERFIKFVNKAFDKSFVPGEPESLKKELDKFLDVQADDYKDLFGEPEGGGKGLPAKKGSGGTGPGGDDKGTGGPGDVDLTKPENNDLIPTDED